MLGRGASFKATHNTGFLRTPFLVLFANRLRYLVVALLISVRTCNQTSPEIKYRRMFPSDLCKDGHLYLISRTKVRNPKLSLALITGKL